MVALLQRVSSAAVSRQENPSNTRSIGEGLLVLLGIAATDTVSDAQKIADKLTKIRVFADEQGKMNYDIKSVSGELMLISQFTLINETKGQNRPSFIKAAPSEIARPLYDKVGKILENNDVKVQKGFFGDYMLIDVRLDGPVTIVLDSKKL